MSVAGSARRASRRNAKVAKKDESRKTGDVKPAPPRTAPDTAGAARAKSRIGSVVVLEGFIDDVGARRVTGWVRDPDAVSERCLVEVWLDDRLLATVAADLERRDLKTAGVGDGRYAFEHTFEEPLDEAARSRVSVHAFSADRSASTILSRFESGRGTGIATDLGTLKLALGKIAAHQTRAFSQQNATLEALSLELGEIGRRFEATRRPGGSADDGSEIGERLSVLEAMHLRFDEALLRLMQEREAMLEVESARTRRRTLVTVLLTALSALVLGLLAQWQFGLITL